MPSGEYILNKPATSHLFGTYVISSILLPASLSRQKALMSKEPCKRSTLLLCTAARCFFIFYCLTSPSTVLADYSYIAPDGKKLTKEEVEKKGSMYTETDSIMMPVNGKMTSVKVPRYYRKRFTPRGPFYILDKPPPEYPSKAEDWQQPAANK
jgi:hypothetical protein